MRIFAESALLPVIEGLGATVLLREKLRLLGLFNKCSLTVQEHPERGERKTEGVRIGSLIAGGTRLTLQDFPTGPRYHCTLRGDMDAAAVMKLETALKDRRFISNDTPPGPDARKNGYAKTVTLSKEVFDTLRAVAVDGIVSRATFRSVLEARDPSGDFHASVTTDLLGYKQLVPVKKHQYFGLVPLGTADPENWRRRYEDLMRLSRLRDMSAGSAKRRGAAKEALDNVTAELARLELERTRLEQELAACPEDESADVQKILEELQKAIRTELSTTDEGALC